MLIRNLVEWLLENKMIRKFNNKLKFIFLFVFLLLLFFPKNVSAQSEKGIVMAPYSTFLNIKTGESIDSSFQITNTADIKLTISLYPGIKTIDSIIVDDLAEDSPANWVTFEEKVSDIEPGQSKKINYKITKPENSSADAQLLLVVVKAVSSDNTEQSTSVSQNLIHQIYLSVKRQESSDAKVRIDKFISKKKLYFFSPTAIHVDILNASQGSFAKPIAQFQLINPKNEILYQTTINESLKPLAPNEHIITSQDPQFSYKFGHIGKFKAQVLLTDQLTGESEFKQIEFWVIPYIYIVYLIAILILITFGVLYKRYKKKEKLISRRNLASLP